MNKTITFTTLIFAIVAVVFVAMNTSNNRLGSALSSCDITTTTAVVVGADSSSTILPARSGRSYARIQQHGDATNTVSVVFGAAATLGNGLELTTATSNSPVSFIEFGMETSNSYTGIVTGITSAGTTTVLVTECR